ncbi:hypothetical protein N0V88_006932 [Collariella sp. IMI 366227]|nr:hypothetical protein N0V88_006932 [Collariella sp. IMI 366227]
MEPGARGRSPVSRRVAQKLGGDTAVRIPYRPRKDASYSRKPAAVGRITPKPRRQDSEPDLRRTAAADALSLSGTTPPSSPTLASFPAASKTLTPESIKKTRPQLILVSSQGKLASKDTDEASFRKHNRGLGSIDSILSSTTCVNTQSEIQLAPPSITPPSSNLACGKSDDEEGEDEEARLVDELSSWVLRSTFGKDVDDSAAPLLVWDCTYRYLQELWAAANEGNQGFIQATSGQGSPTSHYGGTPGSGDGGQHSGQHGKGKRKADGGSDDGGGLGGRDSQGGEDRDVSPASQAYSTRGSGITNFSCPYRKRNPLRFNVRDYYVCATHSFADMSQLKSLKAKIDNWVSLWKLLFPADKVIPDPVFVPVMEIFDFISESKKFLSTLKDLLELQYRHVLDGATQLMNIDTKIRQGLERSTQSIYNWIETVVQDWEQRAQKVLMQLRPQTSEARRPGGGPIPPPKRIKRPEILPKAPPPTQIPMPIQRSRTPQPQARMGHSFRQAPAILPSQSVPMPPAPQNLDPGPQYTGWENPAVTVTSAYTVPYTSPGDIFQHPAVTPTHYQPMHHTPLDVQPSYLSPEHAPETFSPEAMQQDIPRPTSAATIIANRLTMSTTPRSSLASLSWIRDENRDSSQTLVEAHPPGRCGNMYCPTCSKAMPDDMGAQLSPQKKDETGQNESKW